MTSFLDWVGRTPLSEMFQAQIWMISTLQSIHIMAIAVVFTSALVIDMRMLGVSNRGQGLAPLVGRFAPWIGWGVPVLLATGLLLMIAEPTRAILNLYFQVKMAALVAVVALTWMLVAAVNKNPDAWQAPERRGSAKLLAVASLLLWALIITAGRWIAYGP